MLRRVLINGHYISLEILTKENEKQEWNNKFRLIGHNLLGIVLWKSFYNATTKLHCKIIAAKIIINLKTIVKRKIMYVSST